MLELKNSTNAELIKSSNPKDRIGTKKVPQSVIPSGPVMEMGLGMMEGALKYGAHNYRVIGVRASVYYDAAERHLKAFWEGEDIDPDSGLPHIVKVMCCMAVLRDAQLFDNWVDDRPPSYKDGWQKELNEKAAALIDKYPNPKEAFVK